MADETEVDRVRAEAERALDALRGLNGAGQLDQAKQLVEDLRNVREYDAMGRLAEAVSRIDPKDPKNRRLYAQCLIETGRATAAIDVLQALVRRLPADHEEAVEATGLLGRANKQIFFDAADKTSEGARRALKDAVAAYRRPFDASGSTWHGVNLLALLAAGKRLGLGFAKKIDAQDVAGRVVGALNGTPQGKRDEWFLPTLAEASLGLGDWDTVERNVHDYVASAEVKAFHIASTLRQFTQIWGLEDAGADVRGRNLVDILRAKLMQLPGGCVQLGAKQVAAVPLQESPDRSKLEAILGKEGPKVYAWWQTGLERARSVAAIRRKLGTRMGTGFLVRAGDLGLAPPDELVVLTNFHVVNPNGADGALRPEEAEVVFEAGLPGRTFEVVSLLWDSSVDRHDACVLRLGAKPEGIAPLPMARSLPLLAAKPEDAARVYIIGHPGGRDLAFSFSDNQLLDHEGPQLGKPQIPDVWRVHYFTPTEEGSSGSPVFNGSAWEVIALHHKGGKLGMPKLNGVEGTYAANEGIAMQSIKESNEKQKK